MRSFAGTGRLSIGFLVADLLVFSLSTPQARAEYTVVGLLPPTQNRTLTEQRNDSLHSAPDVPLAHENDVGASSNSIFGRPAPASAVSNQVALDTAPAESATSADAFVDTIGFNAHFENHYAAYSTKFPQVKSLLVGAGIRHVRVGVSFDNSHHYIDQMKELAAAGIHGLYVTSPNLTQSQILRYPSLVAPSLEGFEGPNEPDRQPDPNWAEKTRVFQQNLYTWIKGDPQTRQYPVVGPSVTGKYSEIGDISPYMDYANMHNYLSVSNPDTSGFGGKTPYGTYGSIRYNLNLAKLTGATKPVVSTETGYGATVEGGLTGSGRPILDYRAQMRYITRLFFEQFKYGVARTYIYEFIDHGGEGTFDNFGVLQTDLTPKPAYTALKSIIGGLNDPGSSFTTTPLKMQLSGETKDVQHTLFEKRNGQYILAIWLELPSWNPHGGGDIIVPDQQVTLKTGEAFTGGSIADMDEQGNFSTKAVKWTNGQITFPVSDKISLVTLTP